MSTMRVNLIPADRARAARCGARLRAWLAIGTAYALFVVITTLVARLTWSFDGGTMQEELVAATSARGQAELEVTRLEGRLARLLEDVAANRAVSDQADWSILLALLADELDEQIVLRRCRLSAPWSGREAAPAAQSPERMGDGASAEPVVRSLQLAGLGLSQGAVAQFVLRLEQTGLFRDVALAETRREPFQQHHAVSFRIECTIETSESMEATP